MKFSSLRPAAMVLLSVWTSGAIAGGLPYSQDAAEVIGVTHVDGKYYLTSEDFLDEGAQQVLATGTKVLKLYMEPDRYPWNSAWPSDIGSLTELAQTPYFRSVFSMPFHTYILAAYSVGRWNDYFIKGVTTEEAAEETRQFYDLTKYLLTNYNGTGKTFVLQHWEGDWAIRSGSPKSFDASYIPKPEAIQGMIDWLNARQAGIVKARNEVQGTDVHVYGATEVNRVEDSMAGKFSVTRDVLPRTTVDLVSYSCYISLTSPERLARAVNYIASQLPPTAIFGRNPHSVYLGEFGYPENGREGIEGVNNRIDNALAVTKEMQLPWAVFWECYCNEPFDKHAELPLNGKANDKSVRGYWLVKPDGTPGMAWHRFRRVFANADRTRATSAAVKARLKLAFHEQFKRPDGKDLGVGWTQAAHYGLVNEQINHRRLRFEIPDGHDIPWGSATLNVADPAILGHGLNVGDYFEISTRRLSKQGGLGIELFDSDQLRVGGDLKAGPSPLQAWNGATWTPISFDDHGHPLTFDWNKSHTLGVRFDSADGYRATFTYYVDGNYAGSWLVATGNRTLDKIGVYAQTRASQSAFEFASLKIWAQSVFGK